VQIDSKLLQSLCGQARFDPGAVLRERGQHYTNMYLLIDGRVEVDRKSGGNAAKLIASGALSPIGEISFLQGCPATATVIAKTATTALVIDDHTLARIEQDQPALLAHLLRKLASIAEERTSDNLIFSASACISARAIDIFLCRNKDMLESAQRLRYDVYCRELGRCSPNADHERKIIADELDDSGHVFIAVEAGETIGTLRGNSPAESSLGILDDLYGMKTSVHYPRATAVCTKFIVKKSRRGSTAALRLIAAMVRFGLRRNIKECYIDSIPPLLPYYRAIGFTITGQQFLHRENGPSHPMMIDLAKYGERLSREAGMREYFALILKAHAIKLIDRVRGHTTVVTRS
jgi:predicted GNAT family N-acyltransferase